MAKKTLLIAMFYLYASLVFSWNNHAVMTREVLDQWTLSAPEKLAYLDQNIKTESLEHFLASTADTLPARLKEIEMLLRDKETGYQPLPDALFYDTKQHDCKIDLKTCFKKALRINLDTPWPIVVYDPQQWYLNHTSQAKKVTSPSEIMLPEANADLGNFYQTFTLLPPDAPIKLKDIITTAVIQPDFGLDMYLYADSGTSFGEQYGFGTQPLSVSTTVFGTQVFFHMSTYQDPESLTDFLPRLKEDYPEYRAVLYFQLSKFAAETNHPYWAAVFLGWGLHYIQDMTQPYHAVLTNGLDKKTIDDAIEETKKGNIQVMFDMISIQTNRHLGLENLTNYIMTSVDQAAYHTVLTKGLGDGSNDHTQPVCNVLPGYLRTQVNHQMADISGKYAAMLRETFPAYFVDDPAFDVSKYKAYNTLFNDEMKEKQRDEFTQSVSQVLMWFGLYTRNCIEHYKI